MYKPDLMMSVATMRMVEDTVTQYRQFLTAVGAILILDWAAIRAKLDISSEPDGKWKFIEQMEELLLREDSSHLSKYAQWSDEHFPAFPAYLRRRAVGSAAHFVGSMHFLSQKWNEKPSFERYLTGLSRGNALTFYVWPPRDNVEEIAESPDGWWTFFKLKLYETESRTWGWRWGACTPSGNGGVPDDITAHVEDWQDMVKVSAGCAEMTMFSKGKSITLMDKGDILTDSIFAILPHHSLEIPEHYWILDKG